jgi:alpha-L-fucosidase 2
VKLLISILLLSTVCNAQSDLKLWYTKPAEKWTEALPIGNGRLGAMIYGDVENEHLQFNEETLWTGMPRQHAREGAVAYLPKIRQLLAEGKQAEAEALAEKQFMGKKMREDEYESLKKEWLQKVRAEHRPALTEYDDTQWKEMKLPVSAGWEKMGHEGVDGAVWFRTSFELPQKWEGKNLVMQLGRIRDLDFTYVNGKAAGSSEGNGNRDYKLDASLLRKGKNTVAVQVINYFDKGGFVGAGGDYKTFAVYPQGEPDQAIMLSESWKYWVQDDMPPTFPRYQADYQPFGDVWLQFKDQPAVAGYRRELDIVNAVSSVQYTVDGVRYTREYFASAPDQVIVMHLKADKPGKISVNALLQSPHKVSGTKRLDDRTLALSLQVRDGALKGVSYLRIETVKGTATVSDQGITVENADEATFYLVAGTNLKKYNDVTGDPEQICRQALQAIAGKKYQDIKVRHVKEYQGYFNALSLNLGATKNEELPTNERILQYTSTSDPSLITLYVQYGRYLLLSSSRPGTQPANLQGIWNDLLMPPWGSKYTTNINAEMNYWPAELLNLTACNEPLWNMIGDLAEAGKSTAKQHYGAPGWVVHHNTDLWRGTAPINASNHGIWVTGGAWLCHHLWDHYLFTQDKTFLQERAYPPMKQAAEFFVSFLVQDPKTGWLISTPSNSPEQGGLVAGPTMDHQLIRDLFKNCIAASELLGKDEQFRHQLKDLYNRIAPNQVGQHGQLQEWIEDRDDTTNQHRHVSHLWGVYPGTDITWDHSPEMMKAARQSLLYRGDGGTGWSLAWKVNLWARFKDGDHTLRMVDKLLEPAVTGSAKEKGGVYFNLFDAHPPFQIDGNFGGAAGIAEMLVQSHMPYIELLPALPSSLPSGEINGVCARGGFVLNIQWQKGKLHRVEVVSNAGKPCFLKYGGKEVRFDTKRGKKYILTGELIQ